MTCVVMVHIKFFVLFPRKVRFGVWIDILEKREVCNLSKIFLFLFSFVSYLYLIYFIFFLLFYIFLLGA